MAICMNGVYNLFDIYTYDVKCISLDFDDTISEKTGLIDYLSFFKFLTKSNPDYRSIIVTSRLDRETEIVDFVHNHNLGIDYVFFNIRPKKKFIEVNLNHIICHFDDDIHTCRMLTEIGVPTFLIGAFAHNLYMDAWIKKSVEHDTLKYYAPDFSNNKEKAIEHVRKMKQIK